MQNALLVAYNVSLFSAQRQDKRITRDVAKQFSLGPKAGRYLKNRIDTSHPDWKAITRARDYGRALVYRYTLPWQDGVRLISPLAVAEFQEAMADAENQFDAAVSHYLGNRDQHIEAAERAFPEYFRASDYATLRRDSFRFSVTFQPLPHDGHFDQIADMVGHEEAQKMAKDLAERQSRQWFEATQNVWHQLNKALTHAAGQLHHGERIHTSVLGNLKDLCDVLPLLNVADDPELETARKELAALFRSFSVESVKDKDNRKSCAAAVDDILAKLPV